MKLLLILTLCIFSLLAVTSVASAQDLAQGKVATASSTQSTYTPPKANDGLSNTRWSSTFSNNQWWQVDLGAVKRVNKVELNWETAYARRYRVQTSTNGSSWTTVIDTTISNPGLKTHTFTERDARYVRIYGVTRATQWGISLWDARVFGPVVTPPPPPPPPTGTVLFDEQFTGAAGSAPNPTYWWRKDFCSGGNPDGNELEISCDLPSNAVLNGQGQLALTARYQPGFRDRYGQGPWDYTAGRIETVKDWTSPKTCLFCFTYGRMDAWIKMPNEEAGTWSGFWTKGTATNFMEIDVVEYLSNDTDGRWHAHVHHWTPTARTGTGGVACEAGVDLGTGFHKYSAIWSVGRVDILLDDKLCFSALKANYANWYGDGVPSFLLLSNGVGDWLPAGPNPSAFPATMLVDRVLVTR